MSGSWWLPEASDNKVWGILSCSEVGELSLSIVGNLTDAWAVSTANPLLTILGETYGDRGQLVTLRGCFETNTTVSNDRLRSRQTFFGQRGYFGAHLPSAAEPAFGTATLSYSGLASWAQGLTGFVTGEPLFAVKWVRPAIRAATIPGCRFEFLARIRHTHNERKQTLTEDLVVRCEFDPTIPEPEFQSRIAYGLQGLLSFATGRPNALTQVWVEGTPDSEGVQIVGPAVFSDAAEASNLARGDMLFTLQDVGNRLENLLVRWFALFEHYSEVLPLYFGGIYRPPGYTDLRLTQVLQTLTLYQARRDVDGSRPTAADQLADAFTVEASGEGFDRLRNLINSHPQAGAEHALNLLVTEHAPEFAPLIGGSELAASFVEYVSNIQQYLLTMRPPTGGRALEGGDLYWLTGRLEWLVKIIVLKELGFTHQQINDLTSRNENYNSVKLQAVRWTGPHT